MKAIIQNKPSELLESNILPKDWKSVDSYTEDDLISAYNKGKEAGKQEGYENFRSEFAANLKLASSIAEELYEIGAEQDLKLEEIHLKASNLDSFIALFCVDSQTFISDKFRNAYILSRQLKNKYQNEKFHISFSFMANSDDLNKSCLSADGFFIKYEKRETA